MKSLHDFCAQHAAIFDAVEANAKTPTGLLHSAPAVISLGATCGPKGDHSDGWITYLDGSLGKIQIKKTTVTKTEDYFAVGGFLPATMAILPKFIAGMTGKFALSGSMASGIAAIDQVDGHSVIPIVQTIVLAGVGTPWPWDRKMEGTYEYIHHT